MNKYTIHIKRFLDDNLLQYIENTQHDKHPVIQSFKNIFNQITYDEPIITKNTTIKKLHEYSDNPILYDAMKNNKDINSNFNNELEFFIWVRNTNSMLNIKRYISPDYNDILFNSSNDRQELHKMMYDDIFISIDVIKHCESENLKYTVYKNTNTEIYIYTPEADDNPDINKIMEIIQFYRKLTNHDKYVKLVIFYGNQKKLLPPKNHFICSDNINSGCTINKEIIHIWRKEEFYKVLIHELIHLFGIDFYINDLIYNKINEHFESAIKIDGTDKINESYTETLAICIHSVFYEKHHSYMTFNQIYSYELLFTYFQISKIFSNFDFDECNILFSRNSKRVIKQNTSMVSYYIIKCMFLNNLSDILNFWKRHGVVILNNCENEYYNLYVALVNENSLNSEIINDFLHKIKNGLLINESWFIRRTGRMSLFQ